MADRTAASKQAGREPPTSPQILAEPARSSPHPARSSPGSVLLHAQHRHSTQHADGQSRSKDRSRDKLPPPPLTEGVDASGTSGDEAVNVQSRWLRLQLRRDISEDMIVPLKAHEQGVQDTVASLFTELKFIEQRIAEEMALIKQVAQNAHEQIVEVSDNQAMMQRDVIELKTTANVKVSKDESTEGLIEPSPSEAGASDERLSPRAVPAIANRRSHAPLPLEAPTAAEILPGTPRKKSPRGQDDEPPQLSFLEVLITHPKFDAVCATVISLNAVHIAASSELAIRHAVAHPGQGPMVLPMFLTITSYCFFAFYGVEIMIKIFVFRAAFFRGGDSRWNIFDAFLVLTSLYSMIADAVMGSGGMNMGWMRLLKLMKMLKMLRVIRVMAFFKELRMMIQAVQGSLETLLWSMTMMVAIFFVFGVCFLQAVTGYLTSSVEGVDAEMLLAITRDWGSLSASMTTLLATMSGGCQWQVVAAPLKAAGMMYHLLFVLYVCFVFVCVANVFTGIIVDKSAKIATQDYESVVDEIMARDAELQVALHSVFHDMDEDEDGRISDEDMEAVVEDVRTRAFLKAFEIDPSDARRLFKMLSPSHDGFVPIDEFCNGLLRVKGPAKSLDVVCLASDNKRVIASMSGMQAFITEQFNHMHNFHKNMDLKQNAGRVKTK